MARYNIPKSEFESKLRSYKKMEKQNGRIQDGTYDDKDAVTKKREQENRVMISDCNVLKVKFSKLIITKFTGIQLNWFRFWNQFESGIDKSE